MDVSSPTLQHNFGKLVLDGGEDSETMAALLGYQRLEMTAIYTQSNERDLARAVEKLAVSEKQDMLF